MTGSSAWPTIRIMAKVGAVVRRDEKFGVVIALNDADFTAIKVEWDDGTAEWVAVAEVQWIDSRE